MPNLLCLNNAIDSHQVFWLGKKKTKKRRRGQYIYIYDIEIAQKFPLILCRQIVSVTLLSLRGRWNSSREYRPGMVCNTATHRSELLRQTCGYLILLVNIRILSSSFCSAIDFCLYPNRYMPLVTMDTKITAGSVDVSFCLFSSFAVCHICRSRKVWTQTNLAPNMSSVSSVIYLCT